MENIKMINDIEIDTANKRYLLNGENIGNQAISIDFHADAFDKEITIKFAEKETAIKGKLIPNEYLRPVYCSCGEKLCDYSFGCTLYCTKCRKTTTVLFGQSLSE